MLINLKKLLRFFEIFFEIFSLLCSLSYLAFFYYIHISVMKKGKVVMVPPVTWVFYLEIFVLFPLMLLGIVIALIVIAVYWKKSQF